MQSANETRTLTKPEHELDLGSIKVPDLSGADTSERAILQETSILDKDQQKLLALKAKNLQQDIDLRKQYANRIYWLLTGWLIGVVGVVVLHGAEMLTLPTTVLTALVSGVSLGVIGLLATVAKYLFH